MDMTVKEFCDKHEACSEGREWGMEYAGMASIWDNGDNPEYVLWIATREGVLSDKELRLFACWCVRQVWHLLTDVRSRNAVEVAERYVDGNASAEEWAAAWAAAREAASNAAREAARAAAWAAARAAARAAQMTYLREHTTPCFEK